MNRRNFLKTLAAIPAAPYVITTAGVLMPVKKVVSATTDDIAFLQSGTGQSARTIQDALRDYINVRDFGAYGDGITDDSEAVRMAVDYAKASGKHLFFPAGTYRNALLPAPTTPDPIVRPAIVYSGLNR